MTQFEEKKFNIPKLKGISEKNIEEHLKLYAGYVKNSNLVLQKIEELSEDVEKNSYAISEVQRRFGFEFNGMKNHEIFFDLLSSGPSLIAEGGLLHKQIEKDFGSFDKWLVRFKTLATTRGIGWACLYWDKENARLLNAWVDEHHLGHLNSCYMILGLDMWEHAFVADYQPSGKKQYVEDFFANLNWGIIEKNFTNIK